MCPMCVIITQLYGFATSHVASVATAHICCDIANVGGHGAGTNAGILCTGQSGVTAS